MQLGGDSSSEMVCAREGGRPSMAKSALSRVWLGREGTKQWTRKECWGSKG